MSESGWDVVTSAGIGWQAPAPDLQRLFAACCARAQVNAPDIIVADQPQWTPPWVWSHSEPDIVLIDRRLVEALGPEPAVAALCIAWARGLGHWERLSWAVVGHWAALGVTVGVAALASAGTISFGSHPWHQVAGIAATFLLLDLPFLLRRRRGMPGRLKTAWLFVRMLGGGRQALGAIIAIRSGLNRIPGDWRLLRGWPLSAELDHLRDAVISVSGLPHSSGRAWLSDWLAPPRLPD